MKRLIFFVCVFTVGACASQSPRNIVPPPVAQPELAQITVKREFRLVGGGNTDYVYDLFDFGNGIDYESELPDQSRPYAPHLVRIGKIDPILFEKIDSMQVSLNVAAGEIQNFELVDPRTHYEKLVERFDTSLIGIPLLARVDAKGGLRVNPTARDSLARDGIQRIKFRQLYDIRERTLYRVIEVADEACLTELRVFSVEGDDLTELDRGRFLTKQDSTKIQEAQVAIEPAVRIRPDDFLYGETCGLRVSRELHWNARYLGALKGFDKGTWYRPPGRMALSAKLGALTVYANEIEVEAGKQYVGLYDPYSRSFNIEAIE